MLNKILRWTGIIVASVLVLGLILGLIVYIKSEPLPQGQEGPEADSLARRMENAVNKDAWDSTHVLKWTFAIRNKHVWDKKRNLAEVKWGDNRVLINLANQEGIAYQSGQRLNGKEADKLIQTAWQYWVNDSYWLNPVVKAFDKGVKRSLVRDEEGNEQLLLTYTEGGVTPGDSYLWILDQETYRPEAWKMWVEVIPYKGLKIDWKGWEQLETGAWIATIHDSGVIKLKMDQVEVADEVEEFFGGKDPFTELL